MGKRKIVVAKKVTKRKTKTKSVPLQDLKKNLLTLGKQKSRRLELGLHIKKERKQQAPQRKLSNQWVAEKTRLREDDIQVADQKWDLWEHFQKHLLNINFK